MKFASDLQASRKKRARSRVVSPGVLRNTRAGPEVVLNVRRAKMSGRDEGKKVVKVIQDCGVKLAGKNLHVGAGCAG